MFEVFQRLKCLIVVLMCTTTALCFDDEYKCNKQNEGLHIVNSMHCQVYLYCNGSELFLLVCPKGESFDANEKTCRNSSLVYCAEDDPKNHVSPKEFVPRRTRVKRQITINGQRTSFLEILLSYADPIIAQVIPAVRPIFIRQEETVKNKIILPIIFDMLQDDETRQDLRRIFFTTKEAFRPIFLRAVRQQTFGAPRGTVIHIPKDEINASRALFDTRATPLIRKVAEKHFSSIFSRLAQNTEVLFDAVDNLEEAAVPYAAELRQRFTEFMAKHGSLFLNATDSDVQSYTLQEIKEDLMPIGRLLIEIFIDKMSREPRSIFSSLFSRNSILYTLLSANAPLNPEYQLDPRSRNSPSEPIMPTLLNMVNRIIPLRF
ncbi:uncharacterized protein [Parasteatoda tepidariorum]|nr:uncharacterized protein LOC107445973 [Parasteatoda tepidariorum]XP_042896185.1 uncharacterized protein LOC107445973 [Parasteatoda tepidariorum]